MSLFNHLIPSLNRGTADDGSCESGVARALKPFYDVQDTPEAYQVTVRLPGVAKDGVEVVAENDEVRITGRRTWTQPAGWTALHRETPDAGYELVLTHENAIDAGKIGAELRDGVLRVTLPKQEALKPRKIAVA
ncbi:MAG: heat shock protein Hsp20 [Verrucomicrobia bacterium]|nr:heat shock protein Hsp20 [Verrucomicrobiota bacterium]